MPLNCCTFLCGHVYSYKFFNLIALRTLCLVFVCNICCANSRAKYQEYKETMLHQIDNSNHITCEETYQKLPKRKIKM